MVQSLYIHIPFCLKRCVYCDFVSGIYDPEKAEIYINALKKELSNIPDKTPLSTIYLGGGTPTALPSQVLSDLLNHIFDHFQFTENFEATIEANPGTLEKEKLHNLRAAGINRISMGVQSFNNDELSFLGRIHSAAEAEQAVHFAKEAGFSNIGIDLIYGIPGQTLDSWKSTLKKAVNLLPQHISTYELTVEKGTALFTLLENITPPKELNEDVIIDMYNYAIDYLTLHNYIHYEISNFALPGYSSRHNLNYWDRGEYYAAGLGASSFINGTRYYNTDNLDEYIEAVSDSNSAIKDSEIISGEIALSEAVFLGLRKIEGINIESFVKRYKANLLISYNKEINELRKDGLIETAASGCAYETDLRLTRKGLILSNEVFKKFV